MKIETEELVSVSTYASIKDVAVKTVYNWIDKKLIKVCVIDQKIFIDCTASEELLKKNNNYLARLKWIEFYTY